MEQTTVFAHEGNDWYRIPSLVVAPQGPVLAFCQRRKGGVGDFGHDSDVVLRRSLDGGRAWKPPRTLASKRGVDFHHGPAVVDRKTGTILKFCRAWPARAEGGPKRFVTHTAYEKMKQLGYLDHVLRSTDGGATWTEPTPLPLPFPPGVASAATGNGIHGIQLDSGRLLIQGGFIRGGERHSCIFYSDDGGESWKLGAAAPVGGSIREFAMAQLSDGSVYVNARTNKGLRAVARSRDHGESFGPLALDDGLLDPRCHAGLVRLPGKDDRLVFSNPANPKMDWETSRTRLTVRLSPDGGRTWPVARLLHRGPSAYSDLAVLPEGAIGCLYEDGEKLYGRVAFARFPVAWLTEQE
ncbi:MAG: sialidase family protein [Candidatus Brocadiia bacterium]